LLQIVGGALFLAYGAYYFFWKKVDAHDLTSIVSGSNSAKSYILLLIKGFLLNLANPMVVFYWFSVMTLADGGTKMDKNTAVVVFVTVILVTFFSIDLLKIMGAKKLRPLLNAKRLNFLNKFIGMVFIVFGVALAVRGVLGY
jgi:threonine/homoserine/homoserine lactone efflux protein